MKIASGRMARQALTIARRLLLAACLMPAVTAAQQAEVGSDPRRVYSVGEPAWLRAVGQLRVPGSRYRDGLRNHHREDCSATLVARHPGARADTIVTAWHCLEFYNDLSKPIVFTLLPGSGQTTATEAYRLADGGGMHADWAILRLYKAVPFHLAGAIAIHPSQADPDHVISMAGYSRDNGKGNNGDHLTFDPGCRITRQTRTISDSNCKAYKGASGGAVVQLSPQGVPQLTGVISQGDGDGLSKYVPVTGFRGALNQHIR